MKENERQGVCKVHSAMQRPRQPQVLLLFHQYSFSITHKMQASTGLDQTISLPSKPRGRREKQRERKDTDELVEIATRQLTIFFWHGYGRYVCREAQVTMDEFEKRMRRYEPEQRRHNNKNTKTPNQTTKPKNHNKQNPKRSWLISARDVRKEVKIRRSSTGGETGP